MLKETRYKKNRRSVQEYRRIEPIKAASEGGRGKLKSQRKQLEGERGEGEGEVYPGQHWMETISGNCGIKWDAGNRLCLSANRNYLFPIRTRKTTSLGGEGRGGEKRGSGWRRFSRFRTVVKFEKIITTVESTILV